MIRLGMKNCNMIARKKLQKYQHYYMVKLINLKIFEATSKQSRMIDQFKFI